MENNPIQTEITELTRTIADVRNDRVKKYGTEYNSFDDFQVGDRVQVITPYCDCSFFPEGLPGKVTRVYSGYLGITVVFDKPREFEDGHLQLSFNFNPHDLYNVTQKDFKTCECCSGTGKVKKDV